LTLAGKSSFLCLTVEGLSLPGRDTDEALAVTRSPQPLRSLFVNSRAMHVAPSTVMTLLGVLGLLVTGLATLLWWTRRSYPGFGRWATAGPLAALSLFLLRLRPNVPDWVSMVGANAVLVFASVLYVEGARQLRGRPPRSGLVHAGGVLTVASYAFFFYVVRSANGRAAVMSAFMGVVLLLAAITLLRPIHAARSFGLWLTAGLFALCGAIHLVRAMYCSLGPPLTGLFLSGVQGALDFGTAVPMSLFPIGFLLLADERVLSDLIVAKERVWRADAEVARQREAEAVLRESERQFRTMANAAPVLIWMSGPDQLCTFFNQGWLEFTGRSLESELGNGWAQGVHPKDLAGSLESYATAFHKREPFRMEYRLRRHDGEYRWIFVRGVPRFNVDDSFAGYVGSAFDITERKFAEEALSTLSQRLIGAHEEERTRLARELHDDIAQRLTVLTWRLGGLKPGLPALSTVDLGNVIGETCQQITDICHDIQALSHRLNGSKVELLGIEGAAAGLCQELSDLKGLAIAFHSENIPRELPQELSLCLFRVLQEALQNAIKHSGSRHVHVSLTGGVNEIELIVRDSGIGFAPEHAIKGRGLGLSSMKERLKLVNGHLFVDSKPGHGTAIQARVPPTLNIRSAEAAGG
jgi:PAS domain S-box-containing protein